MEKNKIIGRQSHIQELQEALDSNKPEMVALIGRRRVGKTFLIREIYGNRIDFELTGTQNGNLNIQIHNFVRNLEKYFPNFIFKKTPRTWLDAFHLLELALESWAKTEKKIIFLDELPWLSSQKSGFVEALGYFWNNWASKQNIVVVICGSAASWMIKKIINDKGGLHNRVTRRLFLYPFTLAEVEAYCQSRSINLNRYQIAQLYMVMGGIPMYLDQLKSGLSAVQNIQNICFDYNGYLFNEFDRLFSSLFENYQQHVAVVRTLAAHHNGLTREEIIKNSKFSNGGMLTEILEELEMSGFLTVTGGYGKKVRANIYRLTDFYVLFYLTYIEPLGKGSQMDFMQLSDLPKWKTWSGYAYENICLMHVPQIRKALGINGMATKIASFVAKPKDGYSGTQIDLLIDRSDQCINVCEIKFSAAVYDVSNADVKSFDTKKNVFRYHSKTQKHLFLTLITTFGAVENANRLNHVDQVVKLDALFV
jgi:uncharacterized protein